MNKKQNCKIFNLNKAVLKIIYINICILKKYSSSFLDIFSQFYDWKKLFVCPSSAVKQFDTQLKD